MSRDPGLRLGPPPEFLATSIPLPAVSQLLRDAAVITPKNLLAKSSDKEKCVDTQMSLLSFYRWLI
jgi:hypothetical protein